MGGGIRSWAVAFVRACSHSLVGGCVCLWAVVFVLGGFGRWWWWLVLVAVHGVVLWWCCGVVGCCCLVAMSYLVGVKEEAGRVVVPAYLGWA